MLLKIFFHPPELALADLSLCLHPWYIVGRGCCRSLLRFCILSFLVRELAAGWILCYSFVCMGVVCGMDVHLYFTHFSVFFSKFLIFIVIDLERLLIVFNLNLFSILINQLINRLLNDFFVS